jgi:hypothetical protein
MKIICTKQEQDSLYKLLPCKEDDDFSYFAQCKRRDKYDPQTGEESPYTIFDNCFDCVTCQNNIVWEIID